MPAKENDRNGCGRPYTRRTKAAASAAVTRPVAIPYRRTRAPERRGTKIEGSNRFVVDIASSPDKRSIKSQSISTAQRLAFPVTSFPQHSGRSGTKRRKPARLRLIFGRDRKLLLHLQDFWRYMFPEEMLDIRRKFEQKISNRIRAQGPTKAIHGFREISVMSWVVGVL